jgi:hypothetical protein
MPRTHPPYSPEFRRQMVDPVRAGRDPDDLAASLSRLPKNRPLKRVNLNDLDGGAADQGGQERSEVDAVVVPVDEGQHGAATTSRH